MINLVKPVDPSEGLEESGSETETETKQGEQVESGVLEIWSFNGITGAVLHRS